MPWTLSEFELAPMPCGFVTMLWILSSCLGLCHTGLDLATMPCIRKANHRFFHHALDLIQPLILSPCLGPIILSFKPPGFCPHNAPLELRALSEKEASRQLQAVVGRRLETLYVFLRETWPFRCAIGVQLLSHSVRLRLVLLNEPYVICSSWARFRPLVSQHMLRSVTHI